MRIGFVINPIAGMGGRVGLKGTDGVVEAAVRLGATPVAPILAAETLMYLQKALQAETETACSLQWLTCSSSMGEDALHNAGFVGVQIVHQTSERETPQDTATAARVFLEKGCELILFCGGDGTARDIAGVVGQDIPIIGIPSGVKMYSGVFGMSARHTAEIVRRFLRGELDLVNADIVDLDEDKYRKGEWAVRLFYSAKTPFEPELTQTAKALISAHSDSIVKAEIAEYLVEEIKGHSNTLFLLGPGSTVQTIAERLGVKKTLLGVDAVLDGKVIGEDLNESAILALLTVHDSAELVLSPIGAQGFVLGRGNLQISPAVVRRVGLKHMTVVATPAKLKRTPSLRFNTGDIELDEAFARPGYIPVVTGYRRRRLTPIRR